MASSLKILVVDDDRDNADALAELFDMEGHKVRVAYSGEEAIAAFQEEEFDIGFMDVMMPGKNGVESFIEIKKLKPRARVYMMTGYSVEQLLQQALANGALGVFAKPVNIGKVLDIVEKSKPSGIILIAEDDPDFGPALQANFCDIGRRCELATDGRAALDRVLRGGVDVLILDLNLPLINGIEVYTEMRKSNCTVPTVMITGCPEEHRDKFAALTDVELTGILNKPFDFEALLAKLERLAA